MKFNAKPLSKKTLSIINCFVSLSCMVTVILGINLYYLGHKLDMNIFYNSDILIPAGFYKDLIINKYPYASFYFSQANFFFPDIFMWILAQSLVNNVYTCFPIFFTIQIIITFIVILLITKTFLTLSKSIICSSLTLSIICLLIIITTTYLNYSPYTLILVCVQHYGVYMSGLIITLMTIYYTKSEKLRLKQFIYIFSIYVITTLISMSDRLFLTQFGIPLIIALLAHHKKNNYNKRIIFLISIITLGLFSGLFLHCLKIITPNPLPGVFYINNAITDVYKSSKDLLEMFNRFPIISAYVMFFYISCLMLIVVKYNDYCNNEDKNTKLLVFICIFCIVQSLSTISIPLIMKYFVIVPRYFIPIFFTPILFFPILFKNIFNYRFVLFFSFMICFSISCFFFFKINSKIYTSYKPEYISRFDEVINKCGIKYGIGPYWLAKHLMILSDSDVFIAQYSYDLKPFLWETSASYYRDKYDFAISNGQGNNLDINKLIEINGNPDFSKEIENMTILIYKTNLANLP